jgi:hypothetical protein
MPHELRRLEFGLEYQLQDAQTKKSVRATPLKTRPTLVEFDTTGIGGIGLDSFGKEFLERLDRAVQEEPYIPYEANAYVQGTVKGAGSIKNQVWVPIQFYNISEGSE